MSDTVSFDVRGVLLDIEGTTSSVSFVYDTLFPFAREHMAAFLEAHWDQPPVQEACAQVAWDKGHKHLEEWCPDASDAEKREAVLAELVALMDADVKATGLKQVQGLVWKQGYDSGELKAHVYDEVPDCLRAWKAAGLDLRIYSSGSIAAQKLFFGHSIAGDLLELFSGHYDTTTGGKKETKSYETIAQDFGKQPGALLFLSDVTAELDAARAAGWNTCLVARDHASDANGHPVITSFRELALSAA